MRWRTNAAVLAVLIAAAGCAQSDDEAVERAVTQAAQAYVDAIADGDLDTVEALTSDQAIGLPSDPDDGQDIRAELPDADAHIEDPWVRLIGPDYPSVEEPHTFQVSWTLDGLTGGDTLELALEEDTDPTRQESWRVTDALIHHAYFNVVSTVSDERIGSTSFRSPTRPSRCWATRVATSPKGWARRGPSNRCRCCSVSKTCRPGT